MNPPRPQAKEDETPRPLHPGTLSLPPNLNTAHSPSPEAAFALSPGLASWENFALGVRQGSWEKRASRGQQTADAN